MSIFGAFLCHFMCEKIIQEIFGGLNKKSVLSGMEEIKVKYDQLSRSDSGYFECQMPVLNETTKAICFDADNSHLSNQHRGVWIPKSQMHILDMGADSGVRYFVR
jgi:hypothetical protein